MVFAECGLLRGGGLSMGSPQEVLLYTCSKYPSTEDLSIYLSNQISRKTGYSSWKTDI